MNRAPQPTATPAMPDAIRVPNATDPDVLEARKRKTAEEFANRRGRESTNLAQGGSAPSYSRTTLG